MPGTGKDRNRYEPHSSSDEGSRLVSFLLCYSFHWSSQHSTTTTYVHHLTNSIRPSTYRTATIIPILFFLYTKSYNSTNSLIIRSCYFTTLVWNDSHSAQKSSLKMNEFTGSCSHYLQHISHRETCCFHQILMTGESCIQPYMINHHHKYMGML